MYTLRKSNKIKNTFSNNLQEKKRKGRGTVV